MQLQSLLHSNGMQRSTNFEFENAVKVALFSDDATWLRRGRISNTGVCTTVGMIASKVLGTQTKSEVCRLCQTWKLWHHDTDVEKEALTHETECMKTLKGSIESMEAAVANYSPTEQLYTL